MSRHFFRHPAVPIGIIAMLFTAALTLPVILAQPNPSSAPDVVRDAARWTTVVYDGASLGTESAAIEGPAVVVQTAYDVTFRNVATTNAQVVLTGPDGGLLQGGHAIVHESAFGGREATFSSVSFPYAAIFDLREGSATGSVVGGIFAGPRAAGVSISPGQVTARPDSGIVISVTVTDPNGPVAAAELRGTNIPSGSVTLEDGTRTLVIQAPPAGPQVVRAHKQLHAQATNGVDVPELAGSGVYVMRNPVPTFIVGNHSAAPLLTIAAPIRLENVSDFGAATLRLSLNASVASVADVTPGDIPDSTLTWGVDNTTGTLTLLVSTTARPGVTGSFTFATVHLRAAGPLGAQTALDLTVDEALDSDGDAFATAAIDGSLRVGILGDADSDGDIDADDAQAIADAIVGRRPMASISTIDADVSRDGVLSGKDALYLRQHLAGTRPTL